MSERKPPLTPLEARKEMLRAESELNRIHLVHEWNQWKAEIHRLTNPFHVAGVLVNSTAAKTARMISFIRRIFPRREGPGNEEAETSNSWFATLVSSAEAGFSLWKKIRSFRQKR